MLLVTAGVDVQTGASLSSPSGYSSLHGTTTSPDNRASMRSGLRTAAMSGVENPAAYTGSTTGRPWIAMTIGFPGGDIKWGGAQNVKELRRLRTDHR